MRAYVGQTTSGSMLERCKQMSLGEMTVRTELPPRRIPWAWDNGAFRDWRKGKPFKDYLYHKALARLSDAPCPPDFIVLPDIVAGGAASLAYSMSWLPTLRAASRAPLYLAVQDGMEPGGVEVNGCEGILVGGSPEWKIETAAAWVEWAHGSGLRAHIGRCGTANKVRWARRIGADSIDSALPVRGHRQMDAFLRGLLTDEELPLFSEHTLTCIGCGATVPGYVASCRAGWMRKMARGTPEDICPECWPAHLTARGEK